MSSPRDDGLDYARFGRQIALVEIGSRGQRMLGERGVVFAGGDARTTDLAGRLYARAGGVVGANVDVTVALPRTSKGEPMSWALAAWAAVEAARRVLGETTLPCPAGLFERFERGPTIE